MIMFLLTIYVLISIIFLVMGFYESENNKLTGHKLHLKVYHLVVPSYLIGYVGYKILTFELTK